MTDDSVFVTLMRDVSDRATQSALIKWFINQSSELEACSRLQGGENKDEAFAKMCSISGQMGLVGRMLAACQKETKEGQK
ncbi:MAG: hypothetical protein ACRCWR_06160 [Saezia sp.]